MIQIRPSIRKQRKNDIDILYQQVEELIDAIGENLDLIIINMYKKYQKEIEDNPNLTYKDILTPQEYKKFKMILVTQIIKGLQFIFDFIIRKLKKIYPSFQLDNTIKLEDLLYNDDNLTIEERVDKHLSHTKAKEKMNLLVKLITIVDTEAMNLIPQLILKMTEVEYGEIVNPGRCDKCEGYEDGEVYPLEELELPPYHPNCHCELVPYEYNDIKGDL